MYTTLLLTCCLVPVLAVWPVPRQIKQGTEFVRLSSNFTITYSSSGPQTAIPSDLEAAINNTLQQIEKDHHEPLTKDRGQSFSANLTGPASSTLELARLEIKLPAAAYNSSKDHPAGVPGSIAAEMQRPLKTRDESYRLTVKLGSGKRTHRAVLSAPGPLGILRGLQTFSQLVYTIVAPPSQSAGYQPSVSAGVPNHLRFLLGPVQIEDSPAFPYRGLLLDTSRHFYQLEAIRETLDAMSWAKLNVLHWHIVDSQSWPLDIPNHPQLAERGAYSLAETYSAQEVKDLTLYANSKGIEVMLEIDTPGHTSIIGESFPNLIACKDAQPWTTYAAEPPAGQLRIADDAALKLVRDIFQYVAQGIPGTMLSSGGDEVNKKCYEDDVVTQEALKANNITLNQALDRFVKKTHEVIRKAGKTPVVWEELVLDERLRLPLETIVAVWRSSQNVRQVAEAGYPIIHAASEYSYLDCGLGGWAGNATNGNSWCDPFKTWQKIYSFDPYANITAPQQQQILGGQALLWSEQADEQNLDSLVWPRALSTAEVYWTGNKRPRSVTEALPRIHDMRYRMVQRGVRATPLQPHWCAVRPGQCNLP